MNETIIKKEKRDRRHKRIRAKVKGTAERPRLAVFKSNKALYAQLIDDRAGSTLLSVQTKSDKKPLSERAKDAGTALAEEAKKKGIDRVVFDRGGFTYMGVVKAFAEGAREGGMTF